MEKSSTFVAVDDSKRKLVVGILRPGVTEPELREIPDEAKVVRRLFERLSLPFSGSRYFVGPAAAVGLLSVMCL